MSHNLRRLVLHPWWRLTRGLTLGVRGVVADDRQRVLLVRHTYVSGWHLPGGGVERGETMGDALTRELREEANVALEGPTRLHGLFSNDSEFPGDHVAVFIADHWRQDGVKERCREIAAAEFFDLSELPADATPGTRRRIAEIFEGAAVGDRW